MLNTTSSAVKSATVMKLHAFAQVEAHRCRIDQFPAFGQRRQPRHLRCQRASNASLVCSNRTQRCIGSGARRAGCPGTRPRRQSAFLLRGEGGPAQLHERWESQKQAPFHHPSFHGTRWHADPMAAAQVTQSRIVGATHRHRVRTARYDSGSPPAHRARWRSPRPPLHGTDARREPRSAAPGCRMLGSAVEAGLCRQARRYGRVHHRHLVGHVPHHAQGRVK